MVWFTNGLTVRPMDSPNIRAKAAQGTALLLAFITGNIADHSWPVGAKLPTERELERRFGISRNTLRKGLKALEAEGRIRREVGRGSFVAGPSAATEGVAPENLADRIKGASPTEVMEVRLMLEPLAAELAATRATTADLAQMEECLLQAALATRLPDFERWDGRLHLTIVGAAKNGLLIDLYGAINEVRNQAEWGKLKARSVTPERRQTYERQHRDIVAALKERDGEQAKAILRQHLLMVRSNLLGGA